jgi:AAA family ATP:ADP antiporter
VKRSIERALNLQPGDLGRGLLLSSCLFLILSSYVTGKVARDALFLARFKAVQLPYVDIASALLIGFVVAGYVRTARRASLRNLLVGSELFFAANCVVFWALATYSRPSWLFPVFYVWVGIFGVVAPTQVWSLANYMLTTREAKRIFGMVGSGAILGFIFAGFLSKTVARAFGTESLLLAMAALIFVCALLMLTVKQSSEVKTNADKRTAPRDLGDSMRLVISSAYLRAIAAVICISCVVMTLTGWQFKAFAKQFLVKQDALAVFFGNFNFYVGLLSLLFQLLLTTRLLRKFGIGKMLLALPVAVTVGSAAVLAWGTLLAAVFLNASDQVIRYSVDKSSSELLYLPLPSSYKFQVKWFIDTVVWRLGDGLAGVTVLIFASGLHMSVRQMSWIAIGLAGAWILAVLVARKQYVVTLKESISQHMLDAEAEERSALVLDRSATELLASKASASDPGEILYALSLFEVERSRAAHPVVRSLLNHAAPEVRQKAIAILTACDDKTALPEIQGLLKDPDLNVRTEALMYVAHHTHVDPLNMLEDLEGFADYSVRSAVVAYLARPGEAQCLETAGQILAVMAAEAEDAGVRSRMEAARLLGVLPDQFDPLLSTLISDPATPVAREAIRACGMLRKQTLVPQVLELLANQELAGDATNALGQFGDGIVETLQDRLGDNSVPITIRAEIPSVLLSIGTPAAARALSDNLLEPDSMQRFRVISALNKLHHSHPDVDRDIQMLETILAAEILGHYRSYQILHTLGAGKDDQDPMARALSESMQQELERIFRLLSLLYPHLNLHAAYYGLQSSNAAVHDNALEFIDTVLNSNMREMLVPLLDVRVNVEERARLGNRLIRSKIETPEQAVAALVSSDDPWLKSCGAYAIGTLAITGLEGELDRCLNDPDPLLRETARTAKERLQRVAAAAP